jgi:large subunit ribosomal protein L23
MIIDFVKRPVLTEKSVRLIENNQYTFDVDPKLTKPQIKKLIESEFQVNVTGINTHRPPRKKRRMGLYAGFKTQNKRVIITIKSGQTIQLIPTEE